MEIILFEGDKLLERDFKVLYNNLKGLKLCFDDVRGRLPVMSGYDVASFISKMIDTSLEYAGNNESPHTYEDKIRSMVQTMRYVFETYPFQVKDLFIGYKPGERKFRGSYVPESNTEDYCRRTEPLILELTRHGKMVTDDTGLREYYNALVHNQMRSSEL